MQCVQPAHCSSQQPGGSLLVSADPGLLATGLLIRAASPAIAQLFQPSKPIASSQTAPQVLIAWGYCSAACVKWRLISNQHSPSQPAF